MAQLVIITGGVRCGKSRYAVERASIFHPSVTFVASCIPDDPEMRARVEEHRRTRPQEWQMIDGYFSLEDVPSRIQTKALIVDCLTLYISRLMLQDLSDEAIYYSIEQFMLRMKESNLSVFIVTSEVGSGVVPDNKLGRRFRDVTGIANQIVARYADEVILMICGLPHFLKGSKDG